MPILDQTLVPSHAAAPVPTDKPTRFRWAVLFVVALTYLLGAADRANLAVALPYIKQDFHLTNAQAGAAASIFFLGVTLIQIPGSLLIQRIKVRAVMIGAILLTSLATAVTGFANSASHLLVARMMLGVAEGPLPVGGLTTLNRWFPPRERATAVGIFVASFKLAPAFVPPVAAAIIYTYGWREVFFFMAIPGLFIAGLWLFVSDEPRGSKRTNAAEVNYIETGTLEVVEKDPARDRPRPLLDTLMRARVVVEAPTNRAVLRSPHLWGCAIAYCLMSGLTYAILTWIPTYLVEVKKYSLMAMGFVASAPWAGAVLGSVIGGLMSDRLFGERRKPVMLVTAGSTIFTMMALVMAPNNPVALAALLMLTGFLLNIGYSTYVVYPMGLATKDRVPFAVSIVSTFGAIGGGISPVVVGLILDHSSWDTAFLFLSICGVAAFAIVALIIEPRRAAPSRIVA